MSETPYIDRWNTRFTLGASPSSGMREGLQWLMLARLGALYSLLLVLVLFQIFRPHTVSPEEVRLAYFLIGLSFFFTCLQAQFIEKVPLHWLIPIINVVFDAALTSSWLYFSGGQESLFALMYLIEILVVALTFYKRGALIAALVCSLFFGGVILLRASGSPYNWISWAIYSTIFATLGFVGGYLSEELLRTTERLKEKSRTIEKLTELHEKILSGLPTGVLTVDNEGQINFINPAGEHILSVLSRDIVGQKMDDVLADLLPFFSQIESEEIPDEEGTETSDETMATATGPAFHRTVFLRAKSEKIRLQQVVEVGKGASKRVLRGDVAALEKGATGSRVLLFQDVTRLWNLEEKLKQHEKLAAVGQLAAGIAHEIRNPLASVSASIEMLKGSVPTGNLGDENQKLMDIALREIERLNDLITEFLDFVKPENFKVGTVDLKALLSDVLVAVKSSKEFQAKIKIEESLAVGALALANSEKIKQVVWNLVVNAVQALPGEGVIEVGCKKLNDRMVKFWVTDSGAGMSEEVLSHLYEPFFTTKAKGTGLGLATAYRIIEAHHGEIRVKSRPNEGTRFEIHLPAA
jgi:two-component system, NtrC family, sensor histidine kinase PilS